MTWWDGLTWLERVTWFLIVLGSVFPIRNAILNRRPLPGDPSGKLKIRERSKICHQALIDLEARAGINEAASKLRDELPWYHLVYDAAEPGSDERREVEEAEERSHQKGITRRLRELYFTVPDPAIRKELIVKDREAGSLALSYLQQEMDDARAGLKAARSWGKEWWVWASISGIILLGLGFHFFGQVGALGGLLVGYFNGRRMEHEALLERESVIADAERDFKEAEQFWNEARNDPQTFSRREAVTGEPDPNNRLRAV
jgi:hypothetical protein